MENLTNGEDFGDPFAEESCPSTAPAARTFITPTQRPASELLERAALLFVPEAGGWRYRVASQLEDVFFVSSRAENVCYIVHIATDPGESYCTCREFLEDKSCLHLLAMETELSLLAWTEEQERLLDEGEHPIHGTDPDMHYDRAGNADQ